MVKISKKKEIAIRVSDVSKKFKIPHEKHFTLKQTALNIFKPKNFQILDALKDISFEVEKGEFIGIIGKNGSGKSTLLKILAGIYKPNSGDIEVNGKLSPFLELGVGFNPELTARENVFLGGAILGVGREEITRKFDQIVQFAELEEFVDMRFKNFSSGMQVRLAFALAINAHADILLMDEVLAVGDSNFQNKCLEVFDSYKKKGKTVVLVTHDIGIVQRYCNRAILLGDGKVAKIGSPEEVSNEYLRKNMEDEERRMEAPIELGEKRKKKASVKITKVEFLDDSGKQKKVFKTGENIKVRVYFKNSLRKTNLNFGVALFNEDNYINGINTILDKIKTGLYVEKGYFQVEYINVPIRTGSYFIKAGIFGKNDTVAYDFLEKSENFKIFSGTQTQGILELKHKWLKHD